MDSLSITLCLIFGILGLFYAFLIWNFGTWKKRGVPEAKTYPGIGTFPSLFTQKRHVIYDIDEVYRKYRDSNKFVGVYSGRSPQLLILDSELVHRIHVNDFKHFHDNGIGDTIDQKSDPIVANNPFMLKGEEWKERRNELVPGMSPIRIKNIYPVTLEICKRLTDFIREQTKVANKNGFEAYELCLRYTTEVVSDCVLGIHVGTLNDKPSSFLDRIKNLFTLTPSQIMYQISVAFVPSLKRFFKTYFFTKANAEFFFDLMANSIELRRKENNPNRADFLNFLLQLKEKKNYANTILTAHAMTFLTDGFLTTSQSVAHCLLGLARNPEAQKKLRNEILSNISESGFVSFESLSEMPYLDACFNEAIRLFSPLSSNTKLCTQPYEFVDTDGKSFEMKKGEVVFISYHSIHHDERNYEDPEEFRPERFSLENGGAKKFREEGKYMGFGDGPRICMGMRFGATQAKAAIVEIVRNFHVTVNSKTRSDNLLDKKEFLAMLDGGVWLDFEPQTETLCAEMMLLITLWLMAAASGLFYIFLRWNFNYWWYSEVNGPKPEIFFGNLPSAVTKKRHVVYDMCDIYNTYKYTDDFVGIFKNRTPQLFIINPELVRRIYIQDFKHFHDNESSVMIDEKTDFLFANNPFVTGGEKWKQRRSEIIPGLTLSRIKSMFPITLEICKRMTDYIEMELKVPSSDGMDAKDLTSRFMIDVIADIVMGLQSDSFKDVKSPLLVKTHEMFRFSPVYMILVGLLPSIAKIKKVRSISKEFENYFVELMKKTIEMRQSQAEAKGRVDFLNYLLQLQEKKNLTHMELCAHAMTFILDGFETVSSTLAHTLLLLARHPQAQQKLRKEFEENLSAGNRDFNTIHELPYLSACILESLRLFPVDLFSRKLCTEPIVLTNKNGKSFKVPRGMLVIIPKYPIMMDSDHYEDALEFHPERFLEENGGVKKYLNKGVYWCYGDGPRICLGVTFGFVQIKAALVELLTKFRVKPNPKTRTDYALDPVHFVAHLDGGIYLDFELL
ncbi:uncharacterized protein [Musca autumnalis]|uniref:uncharacterized protein n=1 Tax=Musca autumnalis TaxID=221902 RepID=UPI003CE8B168